MASSGYYPSQSTDSATTKYVNPFQDHTAVSPTGTYRSVNFNAPSGLPPTELRSSYTPSRPVSAYDEFKPRTTTTYTSTTNSLPPVGSTSVITTTTTYKAEPVVVRREIEIQPAPAPHGSNRPSTKIPEQTAAPDEDDNENNMCGLKWANEPDTNKRRPKEDKEVDGCNLIQKNTKPTQHTHIYTLKMRDDLVIPVIQELIKEKEREEDRICQTNKKYTYFIKLITRFYYSLHFIFLVFVPGSQSSFQATSGFSSSQQTLSLIHISEPTRLGMISYAVFCLKKKKKYNSQNKMICLITSYGNQYSYN
eukprot:TRINITY_DN6531_c0_g1_i1.p1 TRINITY_DN6531_c0_g1~~TRINITY_DN6531_c0_g1_i1.p1  ORF type:complete len:307 (-),score=51.44 TRINITY_DN6531_c0_g1_i1:5-925(-)